MRTFFFGGSLVPSLFLCQPLRADTLQMEDGSEIKGLVVEQHEDRVVLSTEKGEVPVMRDKVRSIVYDDPEQTFMQIGESYEAASQWGEALAYYEKALAKNPDFEDAKKAAVRVRNRFWSKSTAGPRGEIEKKQELYDSWGKTRPAEQRFKDQAQREARELREATGLTLEKKGDWTAVAQASPGKDAALAGLRRGDRLVAIDGKSLRYLGEDAVRQKFLSPRYSDFTLEYERDCAMAKTGFEKELSEFGLQVKLEYRGAVVQAVKRGSRAELAGLKENDLLVSVNGTSMRYLPLKKLAGVIAAGGSGRAALVVRRSTILSRR